MDKKVKFLGVTFYKRKTKGTKTKTSILGIPVMKKVSSNKYKKYYLFGIRFWKKKQKSINIIEKVTTKYVEQRKYIVLKETSPKELLIVNTDSIGDYILFRNYLKEIKQSDKYKNYKLVLLGCEKYKDFAEYLDGDIVDKFLWCPQRPQNLKTDELERVRVNLHNVQGMKHYYDTIIFSSFNSMPKRVAHEHLVSGIVSINKIIYCDERNQHRNCNDMLNYTYVYINDKANDKFEFDINRDFFEGLLDKKLEYTHPYIEDEKLKFSFDLLKQQNKEYAVINPCAYDKYRMWHQNNWIEIIKYLKNEKDLDVIIVCSAGEKSYCEQLVENSEIEDIKIWAGLPVHQLLATLKLAKIYIGQDSGVFHIAAALNIRSLCLSAGNAYFRFMNYPKNRKHVQVLFPEGTEQWILDNKSEFPNLVRNINCFYINSIKPISVKAKIDELLLLKDIFFVSKIRTENTGDLEISPYDYFSEYFDKYVCHKIDNDYMGYLKFKKATFILGGGGLINQNDFWNSWINDLTKDSKVIAWGIGFNQHEGKTITVDIDFNKFSLLGIRDYNKGYNYLPCVSCLKKELSIKNKIERKIGCIIHYENTELEFDYPTMYNNQPFDELIKFIASSEILITNTYHMMYWATLMGKKVILFNPFSDKFKNFRYLPVKYSGNIKKDIEKAKSYPNALQECRKLNLEFFEKVKKIIER